MTEKLKKATRSVAQHVARARAAIETFEVDQQSGVLPRPTLQAAAIKMAAEEVGQADDVAVVELVQRLAVLPFDFQLVPSHD